MIYNIFFFAEAVELNNTKNMFYVCLLGKFNLTKSTMPRVYALAARR